MFSILIVDKTGQFSNVKTSNTDNLYKKIGLKTETGFTKHCEWNVSTQEYSNLYVDFYGKKIGKATYENKYEFPPPIDNQIFFGKCILVAYTKKNKNMSYISLTQELWLEIYSNLYSLNDIAETNTKKIFIKSDKSKIEDLTLSSSETDEDDNEEDDDYDDNDDNEEDEIKDLKDVEIENKNYYGDEGLELVEETYITDDDDDDDGEEGDDDEDDDGEEGEDDGDDGDDGEEGEEGDDGDDGDDGEEGDDGDDGEEGEGEEDDGEEGEEDDNGEDDGDDDEEEEESNIQQPLIKEEE